MKEPINGWVELPMFEFPPGNNAARCWEHKLIPLVVLRSLTILESGEKWIHLSVSRPDRLPSWPEIMKVKNEFLGNEKEAYQVLPANEEYVNVHSYCLHLWHPVDGMRRIANLQDIQWESAL